MKKKLKYQFGGEDPYSSDIFSQMLDAYTAMASQQEPEATVEQPAEQDPYADLPERNTDIEELQSRYDELQSQFNELKSSLPYQLGESTGDGFLDFIFSDSEARKMPFDISAMQGDDDENYSGATVYGSSAGFSSEVAKREGNYNSVSKNSSATGKYQFLWNTHKNDIERVTGVHSQAEFLNTPAAQEKYFSYWDQNVLTPEASRLLPGLKKHFPGITMDQAKMMIHFGGAGNVQKAIKTGDFTSPLDANGTSLKGYVFRQYGGYAATDEQKHRGLNDPAYDEMFFPMKGSNIFRGLDSGEPVYLRDEDGNEQVLHGPHHTAKMKGDVYEMRMAQFGSDNTRVFRPDPRMDMQAKKRQQDADFLAWQSQHEPTISPARKLTATEEALMQQKKKTAWQNQGYNTDQYGNPTSQKPLTAIGNSKTADRVADMALNMATIGDLMTGAGALKRGITREFAGLFPKKKFYTLDMPAGSASENFYNASASVHQPAMHPDQVAKRLEEMMATPPATPSTMPNPFAGQFMRFNSKMKEMDIVPPHQIPQAIQDEMIAANPGGGPYILGQGRRPDDLGQINAKNVGTVLGRRIGNGGAFNEGVFELKGFPQHAVKFEKYNGAGRQWAIPDYEKMNLADLYKPLHDNQRIGSVLNQFPVDDRIRGLVMNRVANKSMRHYLHPSQFEQLPESTFENLYSDLKSARNARMMPDFMGGNFGFDPVTKEVTMYDLVPFTSTKQVDNLKKANDFDIFGEIDPFKDPTISAKRVQDAMETFFNNEIHLSSFEHIDPIMPGELSRISKQVKEKVLPKVYNKLGPYKYGGKYKFNGKKA